ncbi:MAG: GntR family transcriptional regulator, partial [Bryobacteraceae bacterium]
MRTTFGDRHTRAALIPLGVVAFQSKRTLVESSLKRAIHEGVLVAGQKVSVDEVARQLKVSRTPVREAFQTLEMQGYLRVEPCIGTVVLGLEPQEVIEVYTIRVNLEGLATRLAVPHLSVDVIEALDGFLNVISTLEPYQTEYARIDALNRAFHFGIYEQSGNRRLFEMIRALWDSVARYRAENTRIPGFIIRSTSDHRVIFEAMREGDAGRAERLMRAHL